MATGTGNLPYPGKVYNPFDILTAEELNEDVANIESLADGSGIGDGAIKNVNLSTASGEPGGAWQSWTPTFGNLSGGVLNYAKYKKIGKTVSYRLKYTLGGAGVSGSITFTTPSNMSSDYAETLITPLPGNIVFRDAGTASIPGYPVWSSTNVIGVRYLISAIGGSPILTSGISATLPFTWASTDIIYINGQYEEA